MALSAGGWPISAETYYPFGLEQSVPADANHYKFTGYERDAESSLDHATYRQLSYTQGRWASPDPYDGSYDFANPQSFNRYAYALNNPLRYIDPSGLDTCQGTDGGFSGDCGPSGCTYDDQCGGTPDGNTPNPNPCAYADACVQGYPDQGPDSEYGYTPDPNYPIGVPSDSYYGNFTLAGLTVGSAPNNGTQPGKQSKAACNAQRVANAIPNATLTGLNGSQGGHEEYGIQVSGGALAGAGFSFYTTPFGNGNGYRTPFSSAHVNGQNGNGQSVNMSIQYAYGASFAGQAHFDFGNASSGFGGFLEHTFVDVVLGTLLGWIPGLHNFLDPGC